MSLAATYEVPVDGQEENRYATFEIQNFTVSRDSQKMTMSYSLPLEVTGLENLIELSGNFDGSDTIQLRGENAKAVCKLQESTCRIRYHDLNFDSVLIEARLKALSLAPEEFKARLSVAQQFRADPIGFLKYP